MKSNMLKVFIICCFIPFTGCTQKTDTVKKKSTGDDHQKKEVIQQEPHRFGGWYCPDNLNGFPAVDITNWKEVPVVKGRMPTKEQTQNGTSLIFVDPIKYPTAMVIDIALPQLASFYNEYSKREEIIIVIQAFSIGRDSIVGFRYLNGGNGSARLNEIKFLSEKEMAKIPSSHFVKQAIEIKANREIVWEMLTKPYNSKMLQPLFDKDKQLPKEWRAKTNVNYHYLNTGSPTATYGDLLFGNYYIQNDYKTAHFTEKFMLTDNKTTKTTNLIIVCGPFVDDYENQKNILNNWALKVKELSEKKAALFKHIK